MNLLGELRERFRAAVAGLVDDPRPLLELVRPAGDPRFGDYQANLAMPLGKQLGRQPRDVAAELVARLDVAGWCHRPEVAGPGFINLRLRDELLAERLAAAAADPRLDVPRVVERGTYVVDYSAPNIAKPMHVGHIRSTVIGDALCRILRFLGHRVIGDNHVGDWGTQFGMIIHGYKHFRDEQAYEADPVEELGRLYRLVHQLIARHDACRQLPRLEERLDEREQQWEALAAESGGAASKQDRKLRQRLAAQLAAAREELDEARRTIASVDNDPSLAPLAAAHPEIAEAVLRETARLHEGAPENRGLWEAFMPPCREAIQKIYDRLDVAFDVEYGESFYQDRLADVVRELQERGIARDSEGAVCVFFDDSDVPLIIRKRDGAFLYATTDLATIQFRMAQWQPDVVLYVVDHRQSEHFEKLFATARRWGYADVELRHVRFGTVLGEDGRPFKTRAGTSVGLEGLLDEAVRKAYRVVSENDDARPGGPELTEVERQRVADVVGHAAIKYADLSHNRTSDYVFSYEKMLALEGNTATYMQYSYARTQSIFARGGVDVEQLRREPPTLAWTEPAERALAVQLARFHEAIAESLVDYRPNQLTAYLFELARRFSEFYQQCSVLQAESDEQRRCRLTLCDLTGRTIQQGLALLGIQVVEKM